MHMAKSTNIYQKKINIVINKNSIKFVFGIFNYCVT